jgi:fumarate reductase iron-sulfur subunit
LIKGECVVAEPETELTVSIWRGIDRGRFVDYAVPKRENQTVLDVVTWIQRNLDASLAYRFACRVGMCGSCAMMVNGKPRWTCRTHVSKVARADGVLTLEPLANMPVVKDLVVDMAEFFQKWNRAQGKFSPRASARDPLAAIVPEDPRRRRVDAAIECINCGVCYAACDVVAWNGDYLGPAALNRSWTLMNDERDANGPARLRAAAAAGGCQNCHSLAGCASHCPIELNPTRSIAGLKRMVMGAVLKGESV